jgi:hypothetical protein
VILFVLPFAAQAGARECASPLGAAVPNARTARAIAEAVIAARPVKLKGYVLHVSKGEDGWDASQSPPPAPPIRNAQGQLLETLGGGGLQMHIDRCTGKISKMHYQR